MILCAHAESLSLFAMPCQYLPWHTTNQMHAQTTHSDQAQSKKLIEHILDHCGDLLEPGSEATRTKLRSSNSRVWSAKEPRDSEDADSAIYLNLTGIVVTLIKCCIERKANHQLANRTHGVQD